MNRKFKPNRQGITLLFVISMIVLFLLMGTAFVIVSNDFNQVSRQRIRSNVPEGQGSVQANQLLEEGILQLIRGVDLREIDSPLRTNDILADQYGYGVRAFVSPSTVPTGGTDPNATVAPAFIGGNAFIQFALDSDPDADPGDAPDNMCFDLRLAASTPRSLTSAELGDLSGTFGGRVLSFVSGPAKGFSTRIVADAFTPDGTLRFRIPATSISGDTIDFDPGRLAGSEVIINGRDFTGSGAAVIRELGTGIPTGLGPEALFPNRVGQSHGALISTYLNSSNSVNEPWDAADIATPFLSGFAKNGALIPSFFRPISTTPGSTTPDSFFHAFDEGSDRMPDVDTDGDGVPDSFWMDLGMSVITNAQGERFRPLFAIHIRDLDGLLNVNAHSNRTHLDLNGFTDQRHDIAGVPPVIPRGLGMGPPEINLVRALGTQGGNGLIARGRLNNILNFRYGPDRLPGDAGNPATPNESFRSRAKHFGHPMLAIDPDGGEFGTVGGLYGSSAMDIHGRFRLGSPMTANAVFDDFSDPNFPDFVNGLPQIDMLSSRAIDDDNYNTEFDGNPYEMSLSSTARGDTPFTLQELERLLRPNDIDSRILPNRLSNLIVANTRLFTTDSHDVPMLHRVFPEVVRQQLRLRAVPGSELTGDELTGLANLLNGQLAFAPEFFAGLKMDINRPFGDGLDANDGDTVVDNPSEVAEANGSAAGVFGTVIPELQMDLTFSAIRDSAVASADNNPRVIFARNLYMLAMLLLDPVDLDGDGVVEPDEVDQFTQAMAQWAVNVVDFRDPDSIHTRFVYDPTPFDAQGWNPVFDVVNNNTGEVTTPAPFAVWGCERPELLLTETLAVHIQNMEEEQGGTNFVQRLRPQPFAYFEVYNPWTQNRLNQRFPEELSSVTGDVDLGRMAGDSPVWRFEVEREVERIDGSTGFKPLRYVYMADPTGSTITYDNSVDDQVEDDIEVFFGAGGATVAPGTQALIGTEGFADGRIFMGRRVGADDGDLMLDDTTRLEFNLGANNNSVTPDTVTRFTGDNLDSTRSTSIVFIDQSTTGLAPGNALPRKFSLSDPFEGYPINDFAGNPAMDIDDGAVYTDPYPDSLDRVDGERITADDIDMIRSEDGTHKNFRFVRLQRLANPLLEWDATTNPYLTIDSMEVDLVSINGAGRNPSMETADVRHAITHERGDADRTLWGHRRNEFIRAAEPTAASPDHHYAQSFTESLGRTNDVFDPTNNGMPFAWLTWNNRPFVSHMEIMNVPHLAPERLTYIPEASTTATTFSVDDATINPYDENQRRDGAGALAGRYGHLLNFFGSDMASAGTSTNNFSDMYRLLDYLEVPSRFVGNESYYLTSGTTGVLRHPFNIISNYRVPGKININTIPPNEPGAAAESFVWEALVSEEYSASGATWGTFKDSLYGSVPTGSVTNPFRPADAANLVPGVAAGSIPDSACTLLRTRLPTNLDTPLFDDATSPPANSLRNAAFRNGLRTRLGNMVTTKSSLFAGWITVGYFQVNEDDELAMSNGAGIEIGADRGEQDRNRAFFIFDRSIPVAYEPGKNHNVDKAIRVKTIID